MQLRRLLRLRQQKRPDGRHRPRGCCHLSARLSLWRRTLRHQRPRLPPLRSVQESGCQRECQDGHDECAGSEKSPNRQRHAAIPRHPMSDIVLIVDVAAVLRRRLNRCPCLLIETVGRLLRICSRRAIRRCRHDEPYCAVGDFLVPESVHDGRVDRGRVSAPHGDPSAALLRQAESVGVHNEVPHPRLGIEDVPRRRDDDQAPAPGSQTSHLQRPSQVVSVLVSVKPHTQLESAAVGVARRESRQSRRLVSPVDSSERPGDVFKHLMARCAGAVDWRSGL